MTCPPAAGLTCEGSCPLPASESPYRVIASREVAVSDLSQAVIFISYRRGDSAPYARLMQRDLRQRFPNAIIFLDVDSIAAGLNYAKSSGWRFIVCGSSGLYRASMGNALR
jgi:hypothetical protein